MSKTMSKKEMNDIMKPAPILRCRECERREKELRRMAKECRHDYLRYMKEYVERRRGGRTK
jgi:hypothetical protein